MGINRNDEAFYFIGFCKLLVLLNYDDHLLRTYADLPVKNKRTEKTSESVHVLSYFSCSVIFTRAYLNFIL